MANKKKIIEIERSGDEVFFPILWNIGKRCNYDCTYCSPLIHDMTSPHVSLKVLISVIDTLQEQITDKRIRIWWTGGEPTVNPNFHKLVHYTHEIYPYRFVLGATTNGTRKIEYYADLLQHMNLTFSTHFEYIADSVPEFSEKIKQIASHSTQHYSISVNVMLEPNYWSDVKYMIDFFTEHNIKYDLMKIHGGYDHINYTDEQLEYLDTFDKAGSYQDLVVKFDDGTVAEMNANQLVNSGQNDFRGWQCDIGKESLYIESSGKIRRASCGVGGYLDGDITLGFSIPTSGLICDKDSFNNEGRCTCISDVRIKKWKK